MSTAQTDPAGAAPAPSRVPGRRRRRWPIVLLVVALVLVVLAAVAFVVADRVVRARAEAQIARSVESNLPDGVRGHVAATVDGMWVIPQLAGGRFEHVTLVSHGLEVAGAPASARIQLHGLPTDGGVVERATADLTVGQAAFHDVEALRKVKASDPVIGDGTVSTTLQQTILGLPIRIAVVLAPSIDGQEVQLDPTSATITAGPASVPVTAIVKQLLPHGVSVCAASYLPRGVTMTALRARRHAVTVSLSGTDLDLNHLGTAKTGTCG